MKSNEKYKESESGKEVMVKNYEKQKESESGKEVVDKQNSLIYQYKPSDVLK